ncbi:MAG: glycosyltransferase [Bacillota bacterium]|nr:glycosyltransferase [Bacillota bacterium]
MVKGILISVIMPTLNSGKTIETSLRSIRRQNFDQDSIEILVLDGGSSDMTREIAKKYKAKIIDNPKVKQEYGKYLGLKKAKGEFVIFMDSDEELQSTESFSSRIKFFENNPAVKNLITTGLISPPGFPSICDFINSVGDPFSFFIHQVDGSDYPDSMKKRYSYEEKDGGYLFHFNSEIMPIIDAGTHMFNLSYFKENFAAELSEENVIPNIFYLMASRTNSLAVLKNDYVNHYSVSSIPSYTRKLRWKINNSIINAKDPSSGFNNRENLDKKLSKRKYLYLLYLATILLPMFDALKLSAVKKNAIYLLYFYYNYLIIFQVLAAYFKARLGVKVNNGEYGK